MSEEKTTNVKSLKIKNGHLETIINILDAPLVGSEARVRNKFIATIGKQVVYINEERIKMLEKHSKKDSKGKPILIDKDKKYDITPENLQIVQDELNTLFAEDFVIDILPSNEKEIEVVTKLVLDTKKEFNLVEGATYSIIADSFEKIIN